MKEVIDRVPTRPNRIKLTSESDGSINYYAWERADEPTVDGTPINKELFDSIGADITSLQQTTQTNTSNIATNTSDIQAIKSRDDDQDTNIARNTSDIAKLNTIRVNLLKPTLQTTTKNGVTCANNGDGTYTLNGTATAQTNFMLMNNTTNIYKGMKLLGCPKGGSDSKYSLYATYYDGNTYKKEAHDLGNGIIIQDYPNITIIILIRNDYTCDNLVFKPMITTNLNATYDDFIACLGTSWTQDTTNGYYTQSIICSGITSNDNPTIDVVLSGTLAEMQAQQEEWGKILKVETSPDTLKFYASEPTTVSLSVMVKGG